MPELTRTLRLALAGYGAMGREIDRLADSEHCAVVERFSRASPLNGARLGNCDVVLEFTQPAAVLDDVRTCLEAGVPVVVGTTGWLEQIDQVAAWVRAGQGRLVYASNFSIGVAIFAEVVRQAARLIARHPSYDIALHELHHRRKTDSPSGTARSLAEIVLSEIKSKSAMQVETAHGRIEPASLHLSSTRIGSTPGTHMVIVDSDDDTIELVHRARGRSGFARGAIAAAHWIVEQPPGLYRFEDHLL